MTERPIDVDALVTDNHRLSDDYNVVRLAAPALAALVQPGQFVMVKTSAGLDPLLRRPFSVFERLQGDDGAVSGISILNKRVGAGTQRLYDARAGDRIACLGPLGRPFDAVAPPAEAWMVAGGVGLAPFVTLTEALTARGTRQRMFYGARRASDLHYADWFTEAGVALSLSTEDGSRGARGFITRPLETALAALSSGSASTEVVLYVCGPTPMMRAVARLAAAYGRRCYVSLEQVMGCGLGGCYSCVVPVKHGDEHANLVRSCINGPVFDGAELVWE
jgi:dihydroorotate dehydrogenase electron transfer subunit